MAIFVGRERELQALDERLDEALATGGKVVLVSGEPGVGKTRLVEELSRRAEARGFVVAWGRSWEEEGRRGRGDLRVRRNPRRKVPAHAPGAPRGRAPSRAPRRRGDT